MSSPEDERAAPDAFSAIEADGDPGLTVFVNWADPAATVWYQIDHGIGVPRRMPTPILTARLDPRDPAAAVRRVQAWLD